LAKLIVKGDRPKKNPDQNWSGVINQGASNNLFSGTASPLSGKFGKFGKIDS
jgi:hypothetical protein